MINLSCLTRFILTYMYTSYQNTVPAGCLITNAHFTKCNRLHVLVMWCLLHGKVTFRCCSCQFPVSPTVYLTRKLCYKIVGWLNSLQLLCYPCFKFSYVIYCSPPVLVSDVLWRYDDGDGPPASVVLARNEIGESFFMHSFPVSCNDCTDPCLKQIILGFFLRVSSTGSKERPVLCYVQIYFLCHG